MQPCRRRGPVTARGHPRPPTRPVRRAPVGPARARRTGRAPARTVPPPRSPLDEPAHLAGARLVGEGVVLPGRLEGPTSRVLGSQGDETVGKRRVGRKDGPVEVRTDNVAGPGPLRAVGAVVAE